MSTVWLRGNIATFESVHHMAHIKLTLTLLGTFGLWGEGGALEPELPIRLACSCAV
jgi:hypothetical protein